MKELNIDNIKKDLALQKNGVYKIFLFKDEKPLTIPRFLSNDDTGLVYIGAAEKTPLAYRLTCFVASKNSKKRQNNHSGGDKIKSNGKLLELTNDLVFMYEVILASEAKEKEREMLKNYITEYGEVPPLNG